MDTLKLIAHGVFHMSAFFLGLAILRWTPEINGYSVAGFLLMGYALWFILRKVRELE